MVYTRITYRKSSVYGIIKMHDHPSFMICERPTRVISHMAKLGRCVGLYSILITPASLNVIAHLGLPDPHTHITQEITQKSGTVWERQRDAMTQIQLTWIFNPWYLSHKSNIKIYIFKSNVH